MKSFYAVGLQDEKLYGKTVYTKTINFIGKRKMFYSASGIVIAIGIVAMVISGVNGHIFNYSLDFIGGASTSVTFNENYSVEKLESDVQPVVSEVTGDNDIQMTPVTGSNEVIIKTRTLTVDERDALYSKLSETFGVDESTIQTENISAAVSGEMKRSAILSVIIAAIFMLIYVWIRFKEFSFWCKFCSSASSRCLCFTGILCSASLDCRKYVYCLYADSRWIFYQCDNRCI